jgi:hypothetical protein
VPPWKCAPEKSLARKPEQLGFEFYSVTMSVSFISLGLVFYTGQIVWLLRQSALMLSWSMKYLWVVLKNFPKVGCIVFV